MKKNYQKIIFFFLFSFSIYCSFLIGESWDEQLHINQGKIILDYLFSLGRINNEMLYRENYSAIYWSFLYLVTTIFPKIYQIEVSHLVNLFFSIGTIIGISNLNKEIFNKTVGKITCLVLFFYPVFFGHMSFNSKDTILAFSHVWITYYIFRYIKKQNIKIKTDKYIFLIALFLALSMGIQMVFLGSLLPLLIFLSIDIFFTKKFCNNKFNFRKFWFDLIICFLIFYFILILFWVDTHTNIIKLPFNFIFATLSDTYWTGWPFNLVNGSFYFSNDVPKTYFFINFLYKSPEYLLLSYLIFLVLIFGAKDFFNKEFNLFNYKISLVFFILIFPILSAFIIPYPLYDGIRLFLWTIPYFCIIPGLTFYYLIKNVKYLKSKLSLCVLSGFILFFLYNFFSITPYQYTYLNIFNGKTEDRHTKFENDYWGGSIKELIKKTNFKRDKFIKISICGISPHILKKHLKKKGNIKFKFVSPDNADYMIMTNRVTLKDDSENINIEMTTCFEKFSGKDIFFVKRNGLVLSVVRKI